MQVPDVACNAGIWGLARCSAERESLVCVHAATHAYEGAESSACCPVANFFSGEASAAVTMVRGRS